MNPQNQLVNFAGFSRPSSDFFSARSELRATPQYRDIDLSVARSIAAGTAQPLTMAGNFLYVDQKAASGYATLHFQDDVSVGNTPITVYPGFMAKVPFTQLILENVAQPGQVMRIVYGTDLDFLPVPTAAGVTVLNSLNVNDVIADTCQHIYNGGAAPVGFNVTALIAPATNVRGVRVRYAGLQDTAGAGGAIASFIAARIGPPASFASSAQMVFLLQNGTSAATIQLNQAENLNRTIPAGWGLYHCSNVIVAAGTSAGMIGAEVL